jgi:hypothetical protein
VGSVWESGSAWHTLGPRLRQGVIAGSGARNTERRGRMLSWNGMLVKLLALAAVVAAIAGEGEGWTW